MLYFRSELGFSFSQLEESVVEGLAGVEDEFLHQENLGPEVPHVDSVFFSHSEMLRGLQYIESDVLLGFKDLPGVFYVFDRRLLFPQLLYLFGD